MSKYSNPWDKLEKPLDGNSYTIRRVSEDIEWDIFWAIDYAANKLLIMEFNSSIDITDRLPKLRGLNIEISPSPSQNKHIIVVKLLESGNSDIFSHLCSDIIHAVNQVETEEGAVKTFLMRTWRWHRMLASGGKYQKLSPDEQKGLIAEFYILEQILFPIIGIDASVRTWKGPLDALHDFEIDEVHLEAKARKASPDPKISISSPGQLDSSGVTKLYLHVSEINEQIGSNKDSFTVIEVAEKIKSKIIAHSPVSLDMYLEKLFSAGLDVTDDYSEEQWQFGEHDLYEVTDGFPRITLDMCSDGITELTYRLLVNKCKKFKVNVEDFRKEISADEPSS